MSSIVAEIKYFSKEFNGNPILKNINLNFESGKIYCIVGRNGSGKSILLKSMTGLLNPTTGTIKIFDKTIGNNNLPERIGVLFDSPGLLEQYSALDNLKILASINNKISEEEIKSYLDKMGLNPNDKRPVKKYSLGMKQKVALTQAIMEDPDLILLDEPMNGLDEESVSLVRNIILDLKLKGKCILITSHNKDDIDILCDYVYKIENGLIKFEKTTK